MESNGETRSGILLKQLLTEATRALAHMDVARLRELTGACQQLNRLFDEMQPIERQELACQSHAAKAEMMTFGRVLGVTRANLNVLSALEETRAGKIEYTFRLRVNRG